MLGCQVFSPRLTPPIWHPPYSALGRRPRNFFDPLVIFKGNPVPPNPFYKGLCGVKGTVGSPMGGVLINYSPIAPKKRKTRMKPFKWDNFSPSGLRMIFIIFSSIELNLLLTKFQTPHIVSVCVFLAQAHVDTHT